MNVSIARFAHIAPTPWKNGLGVTTQLAIHPDDATADAFEWRVSIAQVERSTRFSVFEGIERSLAVLQGELTLIRANALPVKLSPDSVPVRFLGDVAAEGHVESGPVLDLNVMTQRARWRASLRRMRLRGGAALPMNAHRCLCVLEEHARVYVAEEGISLGLFDLVRVSMPTDLRVVSAQGLDAYVIDLEEPAQS